MEYLGNQKLTLEQIQSLGYEVEELYPQVFWVKNFLTDEEIDSVMEVINSATEEQWSHHYYDGLKMLSMQKYGRDDIENLVKEGLLEITDSWEDKTLSFIHTPIRDRLNDKLSEIFEPLDGIDPKGVGTVQRQYENVPLKEHIDNHSDPSLVYAAIMYVNDDYTGGELYFTRIGIEFKPHAGSLMIFATGEEYEHGVRSPGPGPHRYVLPCFIGKANYYSSTKS